MKILIMNGPNLNMLGIREPGIYGTETYDGLVGMLTQKAEELGITLDFFQSNSEGALIDRLHQAYFDRVDGVVINPGAYTHYSYALHDALKILKMPKIEVHISDIRAREDFRKISVTAPACDGQIAGQGLQGYVMAIEQIIEKTKTEETSNESV